MTHAGMAQSLKVLLADTYTLYLKTQNYHWNVKGMHFAMLHALFESQYESLANAVDVIAERIRALNVLAPGSFSEFSNLKTGTEAKSNVDDKEMLKDLVASHQHVCQQIVLMIEQSGKENDLVTQDLLIERQTEHEKTIWMLRSHLE